MIPKLAVEHSSKDGFIVFYALFIHIIRVMLAKET